MTDFETAIMIKNMARGMVKALTVKNAGLSVKRDFTWSRNFASGPAALNTTAKNAGRTVITDKIKEIYDREGEKAALDWIRDHPNKVIESIKKQDEGFIRSRLEDALKQYK